MCIGHSHHHKQLIPNYIVAITNLYGLLSLYYVTLTHERLLIINAIVASILCHLADTKRGLPGVAYLNSNPQMWLNYDRVSAVSLFIYMCVAHPQQSLHIIQTTLYPIIAVVCTAIPETIERHNVTIFVICHSIWHIFAFHCVLLVLS